MHSVTIDNLDTRWRACSASRPGRFTSDEEVPCSHLYIRLFGNRTPISPSFRASSSNYTYNEHRKGEIAFMRSQLNTAERKRRGTGAIAPQFLTSVLDEKGKLYAPATLLPGQEPTSNQWLESWVEPRAGVDAKAKRRILALQGLELRPSSTSQHRLSKPTNEFSFRDHICCVQSGTDNAFFVQYSNSGRIPNHSFRIRSMQSLAVLSDILPRVNSTSYCNFCELVFSACFK
jgi:hypothetical protein